MTANALTTGSILRLTSSSGTLNSTDGLLVVRNIGTSTTGTVARIQANSSDATSGLTVLANGNVGVGTPSPGWGLTLKGNTAAKGLGMSWNGACCGEGLNLWYSNAGSTNVYLDSLFADDNATMQFRMKGGTVVPITLKGSGFVGIGTNAPATALDINGAVTMRGMATAPASAPAGQGRIYFNSTESKYKVSQSGGAYADLAVGPQFSGIAGSVQFSGGAAVSSDSSNFFWNNSTKSLGIGTNAPATRLQVDHAVAASIDLTTVPVARLTRPPTGGYKHANAFDINVGSYTASLNSDTQVDFRLASGSTHTPDTTIMTLRSNGRVGIGTTAPINRLDVVGAATIGSYAGTVAPTDGLIVSGRVGIGTTGPGAQLHTITSASGTIGQIIRGAAGQTANLLEFQNNTGTTLSGVNSSGGFYGNGSNLTGVSATPSGSAGSIQFSGGAAVSSDSSNFFWNNTNKRLGIGTATTSAKLHLSGGEDGGVFTNATIALGYSSTGQYPHFIHTRHNGSGTVNNAIDFYTSDGTAAGVYPTNAKLGMTITDGNVGIGTGMTAPATALDINGAETMRGIASASAPAQAPVGQGRIYFNSTESKYKVSQSGGAYADLAVGPQFSGIAGSIQFSGGAAVSSDSSNFFWNNSTKRLGIGTATPSTQLHIANSAGSFNPVHIQIAGNGGIVIERTGVSPGSINLSVNASGKAVLSASQDISFSPFGASDALNVKATTGNVGIGTTAPTEKLAVAGTGAIGGTTSMTTYSTTIGDSSFLQFKKSNSNTLGTLTSTVDTTELGGFSFYGVGSGASWAFGGAVRGYQDGAAGTTAIPTRFEISTSPGGSTAPISRIAIKPDGNVGIGTTTPTAKLDVTGQTRSTNSGGITQTNATTTINWNNGNVQTMSVDCASTAFQNMLDGATYVLAVSETGTSTCVFSHASPVLTFYYSPANAARYSGQRTVYTFQRIGTDVYVSWVRGFQ
jgi:hypothetical protein